MRGEREGRGQRPPYCTICGENASHITKDCKYNRMARELKEKDNAARGSKPSKHVFHSANHEIMPHQPFSKPYIPTSVSTLQQPSYPLGYYQSPYTWQQPTYQAYQHFAQHLVHSAVVSSPAQQEPQQSSQIHLAKQESAQEHQAINNILPS